MTNNPIQAEKRRAQPENFSPAQSEWRSTRTSDRPLLLVYCSSRLFDPGNKAGNQISVRTSAA